MVSNKKFSHTKIFAGEQYKYSNTYKTKKHATVQAAAERTMGMKARVVKDGKEYMIYLRKK